MNTNRFDHISIVLDFALDSVKDVMYIASVGVQCKGISLGG